MQECFVSVIAVPMPLVLELGSIKREQLNRICVAYLPYVSYIII